MCGTPLALEEDVTSKAADRVPAVVAPSMMQNPGIEKGNTTLPPDLTADGQKRTVAAVSEDSSQPTSANSSAKWLYTESPGSSKSDVSKRSPGQVFHKALATLAAKQSCKEGLNSAKFKLQRVVGHYSIPEEIV